MTPKQQCFGVFCFGVMCGEVGGGRGEGGKGTTTGWLVDAASGKGTATGWWWMQRVARGLLRNGGGRSEIFDQNDISLVIHSHNLIPTKRHTCTF